MGAGAERIALDIQTSADVSGATRARQEVELFNKTMAETNNNMVKAAQAVAEFRKQQDAAAQSSKNAGVAAATTPAAASTATGGGGQVVGSITPAGVSTAPGGGSGPAAGAAQLNQQLALTPSRARTAANAVAVFANSAATGQFSVSSLAAATGNLASAIATVSNVAKTVAIATWIGIALQLITTIVGFVEKYLDKNKQANAQVKELESSLKGINAALADDKLTQNLEQIRASTQKEVDSVRERYRYDLLHNDEERKLIGLIEERGRKEIALAQHEVEFRLFNAKQIQSTEFIQAMSERERSQFQLGDFKLRERQLQQENIDRKNALQLEYESRSLTVQARKYLDDLLKGEDAITEQKREQVKSERLLAQSAERRTLLAESGNLYDRTKGALAEIQHRKNEEIVATEDVVTATAVAEQRKRNLYRDTRLAAEANAKTLIDVIRQSGSAQVHAIGTAAETFRRLVIGAEAAHSAVQAVKEGAAAIASLAIGDFRGAALHGAASLEYAKAAALGASESLGGGTAAGSGGGGGGGGQFVPNQQGAGGNQTLIIQIGDVSNQALINTVRYEIDRSWLLNKPVVAPSGRPS